MNSEERLSLEEVTGLVEHGLSGILNHFDTALKAIISAQPLDQSGELLDELTEEIKSNMSNVVSHADRTLNDAVRLGAMSRNDEVQARKQIADLAETYQGALQNKVKRIASRLWGENDIG